MRNAPTKSNLANRSLPAIFAVGTSLAALPAAALQLGELTVQSRLGQPLRASIAYALAPNEQISNHCVTLRPGASVSGLPGFGPATLRVANGVILLSGSTPVREPMVAAHIVINCPYSASLSREYQLFIDPHAPLYDQTVVTQQATPDAVPVAVASEALQRPVVALVSQATVKDISASTQHRVQVGDTLSDIASRIQNRPIGLWPAVNAIFAANPHAFIANDPNRLIAGSTLSIPDFVGTAAPVAVAIDETIEETTVAADSASDSTAALQAYDPESLAATPEDSVNNGVVNLGEFAETTIVETSVVETSIIQPTVSSTSVIIDADLEGPTTTSTSPNVPVAIITMPSGTNAASSTWLIWLTGSGIAIIAGLLMFGRRFRRQPASAPLAPAAEQTPLRRFSDNEKTDTENVEALGVDFDLTDDSPTEENLALDADLVIGTGLEDSSSANKVSDFGFAAAAEVDVELPFEPIAPMSEGTDIMPPLRTDEHSILESEVMPEDDYDMSVIVDATKMPRPEDVTKRDLKAVEVVANDDTLIAQNYTISKEVDFNVLEQDYEDEFSATQALNLEIARAAAELVEHMEDDSADDELTAALPLASVTELDVTAQMPAQNDDVSEVDDPDATGVNEAVTVNTNAEDDTVEMPAESGKAS